VQPPLPDRGCVDDVIFVVSIATRSASDEYLIMADKVRDSHGADRFGRLDGPGHIPAVYLPSFDKRWTSDGGGSNSPIGDFYPSWTTVSDHYRRYSKYLQAIPYP